MIGDGAMSAGMAFEALNNAGAADADMLVVLNDNDMSISEPVGAFNNYLARLMSGSIYNTVRRGGKEVLSRLPPVQELAKRWEEHMKGMVLPGTLFEEFGFNYIGPIDGHDLDALVKTLRNVSELKGPQLLHVVTRKGQATRGPRQIRSSTTASTQFDPDVGIVPKPPGEADLHAGVRRLAVRHGATATRAWSASRPRCAKARAWCAFRRNSRTAISMSASPSSTRSPSPPALPARD